MINEDDENVLTGPAGVPITPVQLDYAPPAKRKIRVAWVLVAGVTTTVLTVASVYVAQATGTANVMGWYINYVLPVGAILVGLAASSGYAIVSWWLGVKVRKGLLAIILGLMFLSFFAAKYVEFIGVAPLSVSVGSPPAGASTTPPAPIVFSKLAFWEYFHLQAISWTWSKEQSTDKDNQPLGIFGYFFVLLGLVGFAGSGLIIPALIGMQSYCELCEQYMSDVQLASWPASTWDKTPLPSQVAAYEEEQRSLFGQALARLDGLRHVHDSGDLQSFYHEIVRNGKESRTRELPLQLTQTLVYCRTCMNGHLRPKLLPGKGNIIAIQKLPQIDLSQESVRTLLQLHQGSKNNR